MLPANDRFRFMHLGVAVADLSRAMDDYVKLFGYQLVSGPFDDPIQKVTVCFLEKKDNPAVELIAPLDATSPVRRLLDKGGGAYHMCYAVNDIEQALTNMRLDKCIIVSKPVPAVAFGGRKIAWVYTPSRLLVELVESE